MEEQFLLISKSFHHFTPVSSSIVLFFDVHHNQIWSYASDFKSQVTPLAWGPLGHIKAVTSIFHPFKIFWCPEAFCDCLFCPSLNFIWQIPSWSSSHFVLVTVPCNMVHVSGATHPNHCSFQLLAALRIGSESPFNRWLVQKLKFLIGFSYKCLP